MHVAIISDIHEDFISLCAVMAAISKLNIDKVFCLGDVMGFENTYYTYEDTRTAKGCYELLYENSVTIIAGNHEINAIERIPHYYKEILFPENWYSIPMDEKIRKYEHLYFTYKNEATTDLQNNDFDRIKNLKSWEVLDTESGKVSFSHFIYPDINGNLTTFFNNKSGFAPHFDWMKKNEINISFVGHTHMDGVGVVTGKSLKINKFGLYSLGAEPYIILCPAIARGKSKNGYIVFDTINRTIEAIRI